MNRINKLEVYYHDVRVGTMALYQNCLALFEYDNDWIADGFSISPFSLPLEKKVFMPKRDPFDGIFGVFADSLPDGWGRLLVDSLITKASLGTSPISSIPYVLSLNFAFTLGNFTIFFSVLLILLQILILRKNFKLENVLQIPVSEKVLL